MKKLRQQKKRTFNQNAEDMWVHGQSRTGDQQSNKISYVWQVPITVNLENSSKTEQFHIIADLPKPAGLGRSASQHITDTHKMSLCCMVSEIPTVECWGLGLKTGLISNGLYCQYVTSKIRENSFRKQLNDLFPSFVFDYTFHQGLSISSDRETDALSIVPVHLNRQAGLTFFLILLCLLIKLSIRA